MVTAPQWLRHLSMAFDRRRPAPGGSATMGGLRDSRVVAACTLAACGLLQGCGGSSPSGSDSGWNESRDSGPSDSGATDAGPGAPDSGSADAGQRPDSGTVDAGVTTFWCRTDFPSEIRAIWGRSSSDVFVTAQGAVAHWDGGSWGPLQGLGNGSTLLTGIHGELTGADVWAVGSAGAVYLLDAGQRWQSSSVAPPTTGTIYGVSGQDSEGAIAVGQAGLVLQAYGGQLWSSALTCPVSQPAADLYGVWASSACSWWAVGQFGTVVHVDGGTRDVLTPFAPRQMNGVHGVSDSDVWFAGEAGTIGHWNGQAFSSSILADAGVDLVAVYEAAAGD